MPSATKILAPLKDAIKRHGGDDGADQPATAESFSQPQPPARELYVARDYAREPVPSQDGDSQLSSDTKTPVQPPRVTVDFKPYPSVTESPEDTAVSGGGLHPLDAQSDLASAQTARYAEEVDSEEGEREEELTYSQLRRLYDDEEIERFLTVFAKNVTEVTLAPSAGKMKPRKATVLRSNDANEELLESDIIAVDDSDAETDVDEPWAYLNQSSTNVPSIPNTSPTIPEQPPAPPEKQIPLHRHHQPKYLSARIAAWIIPKLPPAAVAPPQKFKLSSVRLAGQRLYVATYPFYAPFFADLAKLAAWTDWNRSARVCTVWWIFWYFNLLLPALFGKMLFSLLRRRVLPYPNLKQLRERRKLAREADQMSDAIEGHGAATSFLGTGPVPGVGQGGGDMGIRDMWKLTRTVAKGKSKKGKEKVKNAGEAMASQVGLSAEEEEAEARRRQQEDEDWRRVALKILEAIADFHERVRNMFLWRRERSSRIYSLVLLVLVLFTALTPAKILAKTTYAIIGILYWFVVPVLLAMPPEARKCIPAPLFDVPTDAEYAMSLMSIRVAKGESVVPASLRARREHGRARRFIANMSVDSVTRQGAATDGKGAEWDVSSPDQDVGSMRQEANEKEAVAANERATANTAQIGTLGKLKHRWDESTADLLGRNKDDSDASLQSIGVPQTVPANHKATPGTLSLNSEGISFIPLLTSTPRLRVNLENIQGVKKTTKTSGLRVRHLDEQGVQREDVFRFIPNRDEIFGKLVGWGGRRWKKVP